MWKNITAACSLNLMFLFRLDINTVILSTGYSALQNKLVFSFCCSFIDSSCYVLESFLERRQKLKMSGSSTKLELKKV